MNIVIAPHPDDEAIGCGGTIRRHVERGEAVHVIFLTSGEKGCRGRDLAETARTREAEAEAAKSVLGITGIEFWRQPDGSLAVTDTLVARLIRKLKEAQPDILYVPHEREMHPDHCVAARLVSSAVSSMDHSVPNVLMYEVWTPLQQIDHVEDISEQIDLKIAAILAHKSQCAIMRFDESARGLARYRGEMHSWPGGPYAEVFQRLTLPVRVGRSDSALPSA